MTDNNPDELNPEHPVTKLLHSEWHKLAAILVQRFTGGHVVITEQDIRSLPVDCSIVAQEFEDGLHLRIVSRAEANSILAAQRTMEHL